MAEFRTKTAVPIVVFATPPVVFTDAVDPPRLVSYDQAPPISVVVWLVILTVLVSVNVSDRNGPDGALAAPHIPIMALISRDPAEDIHGASNISAMISKRFISLCRSNAYLWNALIQTSKTNHLHFHTGM